MKLVMGLRPCYAIFSDSELFCFDVRREVRRGGRDSEKARSKIVGT